MKVITSPGSPYGFRLRLACRLKELDLLFEAPPVDPHERRALSPFGRIPMMVLEDGTVLVESLALLDFLEDSYEGKRALRPLDPVLQARVRMIALLFDHNVVKALGGAFVQVIAPAPDVQAVRQSFDEVAGELGKLAHFLDPEGPAVGNSWSTVDCVMAPFVVVMRALAERFDVESPDLRVPRFVQWWRAISAVPAAAAVFEQHRKAIAPMLAPQRPPRE